MWQHGSEAGLTHARIHTHTPTYIHCHVRLASYCSGTHIHWDRETTCQTWQPFKENKENKPKALTHLSVLTKPFCIKIFVYIFCSLHLVLKGWFSQKLKFCHLLNHSHVVLNSYQTQSIFLSFPTMEVCSFKLQATVVVKLQKWQSTIKTSCTVWLMRYALYFKFSQTMRNRHEIKILPFSITLRFN